MLSSDGQQGILRWALAKALVIGVAGTLAAVLIASVADQRAAGGGGPPARPLPRPPEEPQDQGGERTLVLRADARGQFWVDGVVNGRDVRFVVDTGASAVAFGRELAERIGVDVDERDFTLESRTANGIAAAAPVTLRSLRIGAIEFGQFPAVVMAQPMGEIALLGTPFLSRLESYEVRGDRLELRW